MEGWYKTSLSSICRIYGRIGFRGYTQADLVGEDEGAITLSPSNIQDNKISYNNSTYISWKKYHESPEIKINEGDIVFVKTGSTFGKTALIRNLLWPTTINPQFIVIKDIKCNNLLLSYVSQFYEFQNEVKNIIGGSTIPTLSQKEFNKLDINLPNNNSEQQKIAAILSAIDKNIEITEQIIAKQKNIKTGLMHDLLSYGVDYEGQVRLPNKHKFVEKNGVIVPEEWDVKELSSFSIISDGKRLPKGEFYSQNLTGYRYLRVTDFYKKAINYHSLENISAQIYNILKRYQIKKDDLFISIAGSIGFVGVLKPNIEDLFILTENALKISLLEKDFLPDYISNQMNFDTVQQQIWSETGAGGGVPKLALHRVKSLRIPLAPPNEQRKIINILNKQDLLILEQETELEKLKYIKKGLMKDLLTGKVRVNY